MIAAIYARKSTEQTGVEDEQRSVTRQVDHATAYATKKGWQVASEYIYVDDGISGAEFTNRPGFLHLMNALKPAPAFQVLIMSEASRLGREQVKVSYAMQQVIGAGVRIFFYLEDRELTLDSATDKIMLSLTAFADEMAREQARQRTYDAMVRIARAGHVAGGRCFGYTNVDVFAGGTDANGRPQRSHVIFTINEAEAAVVRRLFQLCAEGRGMRAIAKQLNDEGACCPRSQRARPPGWSPATVGAILYRETYRGQLVWNRTGNKRERGGCLRAQVKPQTEWVNVDMPALQIVASDVWDAAHASLAAKRAVYLRGTDGRLWGRPLTGIESKYLLPGLARCGWCNGTLRVSTRSHGRHRVGFYGCSSYHDRGRAICTNNLEVRVELVDRAVIQAVEDQLLRPDLAERALALALARLQPALQSVEQELASLKAGIGRLDGEILRLTDAIAGGGDVPSLVVGLKDRERQREDLRGRLTAAQRVAAAGAAGPESPQLRLRAKLAEWQNILHRQVPQARQILKKVLCDSLRFTPKTEGTERYYEFSGEGSIEKAYTFSGTSPTGFEPVFRP